jgi:hypothetical protein
MNCWARKEEYLLIAHKPTIADENSMDALDKCPNRDETAEKSAGQVGVDRMVRALFYLSDRYPTGYTGNGHSIGSWIGRLGRGPQFGAKYGFNACDRSQSNFRQPKVMQRHILGGSTLMDADARGDSRARSNINFSCSTLFPIVLPKAQWNAKPRVPILFHKRFFRRLGMSATKSEFWNGGRS